MSVDDDKLMAFVDGELPPAERAEIEHALAAGCRAAREAGGAPALARASFAGVRRRAG